MAKGKKKCVTGYSCGSSCINVSKLCRVEFPEGISVSLDRASSFRTTTPATIEEKSISVDGLTQIGSGEMGTVYVNPDEGTAIKVRNEGQVMEEDPEILQELNEMGIGPRTLAIERDENGDLEKIEMEYLDGTEAFRYMSPGDTFNGESFSDQLRRMHERGLVHYDLHHGNMYLDQQGNPGFLDFGAMEKLERGSVTHAMGVLTDLQTSRTYSQALDGGNGPEYQRYKDISSRASNLWRRYNGRRTTREERIAMGPEFVQLSEEWING